MLDRESIYVWRVNFGGWLGLGASEPALARCLAVLSAEELQRVDGFRLDVHRHEYAAYHAALRCVLGECLGTAPAQVKFRGGSLVGTGTHPRSGRTEKPAIEPPLDSADASARGPGMDLRFNLSHTQGAALIGVAAGRELGIDIERLRPMEDLEAMARSVMSHEELEQWTTIHPADQELAFYRLWTRKEAYLKAIGLGLFRNLQDVTVPVVPQFLEPDRVHWVQDRAGEGRWQLRDIAVGAGYAGAICCEGAEPVRLVVRDMDPLVMEYAVPEEE